MTLFLDYTLDGIANGMVYATLALALVLIYRATRIINFAQGAAGMLTTFIAFSLLSRGLGYWWAFVLVLIIGFAIGAVTERLLIRPLHGKSAGLRGTAPQRRRRSRTRMFTLIGLPSNPKISRRRRVMNRRYCGSRNPVVKSTKVGGREAAWVPKRMRG